ncbi:MAG: hypothetical protein JWP35_2538 [Caulobacter sp.]|nr:hypothetical protein [Caulobacter sp.]
MPAADEQKAIGHVLRLLRSEWDDWDRHHRPAAAGAAAAAATGKFDALGEQALNTHMLYGSDQGQFADNQVVYVKPPHKEPSAVAGIWCRWDYQKAPPRCGFYYGIWSSQPPHPKPAAPHGGLHVAFVGYRFETPEDGDNHNFYHAQPCRSMGAKDDPVDHALPISQRDPTWPLAAKSALDLLLCLVTSLYGMHGLVALKGRIEEEPSLRQNGLIREAMKNVLGLQHSWD